MEARWRRNILVSLVTSAVLAVFQLVAHDTAAWAQAYKVIESFAPWNLLSAYYRIVTVHSGETFPALIAASAHSDAVSAGTSASTFCLSCGAALYLRPITAIIDLFVHLLADAGFIGFLFAAAQLALGLFLTLWLTRKDKNGFYFYTLGLPLGAMVAGSVAAIPLWLVALASVAAFKGVLSLALQGGATSLALSWTQEKLVEATAHEFVETGVKAAIGGAGPSEHA